MPKVVDHEAMRDTLADRCAEALAVLGYRRSSIRSLAKAAGVSTGTLYHYFPDKPALFEHVVTRVVRQDISTASDLLVAAYDEPAERLRPLVEFVAVAMPRLVGHFRVLNEYAMHIEGDGDVWTRLMRESRTRYLDALRVIFELDDDARLDMVLLTICGMVLRGMCGDSRSTDVDDVVAQLERVLA